MSDIVCPFCKDSDFDFIGLKAHLERGGCDIFDKTPKINTLYKNSADMNGGKGIGHDAN